MDRAINDQLDRSISASDFRQLNRADAPDGGLADWLSERLRQAIADGQPPVGSKLPASRVLAGEPRVSRGMVTEAYRRPAGDGQLAGDGRGGTTVVAAPAAVPAWAPARLPAMVPAPRPRLRRRPGWPRSPSRLTGRLSAPSWPRHAGSTWHRQRPGSPGLVLGCATSTPEQIGEGAVTIGRILGAAGSGAGSAARGAR